MEVTAVEDEEDTVGGDGEGLGSAIDVDAQVDEGGGRDRDLAPIDRPAEQRQKRHCQVPLAETGREGVTRYTKVVEDY